MHFAKISWLFSYKDTLEMGMEVTVPSSCISESMALFYSRGGFSVPRCFVCQMSLQPNDVSLNLIKPFI